jgi:hypothetical protein
LTSIGLNFLDFDDLDVFNGEMKEVLLVLLVLFLWWLGFVTLIEKLVRAGVRGEAIGVWKGVKLGDWMRGDVNVVRSFDHPSIGSID